MYNSRPGRSTTEASKKTTRRKPGKFARELKHANTCRTRSHITQRSKENEKKINVGRTRNNNCLARTMSNLLSRPMDRAAMGGPGTIYFHLNITGSPLASPRAQAMNNHLWWASGVRAACHRWEPFAANDCRKRPVMVGRGAIQDNGSFPGHSFVI
jgi:hypothetical protein